MRRSLRQRSSQTLARPLSALVALTAAALLCAPTFAQSAGGHGRGGVTMQSSPRMLGGPGAERARSSRGPVTRGPAASSRWQSGNHHHHGGGVHSGHRSHGHPHFGTGHEPYLRTPSPVPPGATQPGFSTGGHPGFNLQPGGHPGFNRQPGGLPGFSTTSPDLGEPRFHDHPARRHKHPRFDRHPGFDRSPHFDHSPGVTHGRPGFDRHPGFKRPGHFHRFGWRGGFWHGSFWPHVHYHANVVHFLPVLPAVYSMFWHDGVSYFYVDNAYYTWNPDRNGYLITDPPPAIESGTSAAEPEVTQSEGATYATEDDAARIYVYPRNGQSEEQTANDRYECHQWAVSQTGFDPTRSETSGAGPEGNDPAQSSDVAGNASSSTAQTYATASDYRRALIACLDARGYSAR